jgi:hypothetical protein
LRKFPLVILNKDRLKPRVSIFPTRFMPLHQRPWPLSGAAAMLVLALSSCSAPISYRHVEARIPAAASGHGSHSEAVAQLNAATASGNPQIAAGRFFDAAKMASAKAMAGDPAAHGVIQSRGGAPGGNVGSTAVAAMGYHLGDR